MSKTTNLLTGNDVDSKTIIDPNLKNEWQKLHGRIGEEIINSPAVLFSTGSCGKTVVSLRDSHGSQSQFMPVNDFLMIIMAGAVAFDDILNS